MANRGSWFFEGYQAHYEVNEKGRKRKVLTYTGEYYGIEPAPARRKARLWITLNTLVLTGLLLLIQFFPGTGGNLPWVGIPCMWALVPLMFLLIGWVNFLAAGEKWEIRKLYAGYRRIRRCAWALTLLTGYVFLAHLVTLFLFPQLFPSELYYTLGALASALLSVGLLLVQRAFPAYAVQGPTIR